MGMSGDYAAAIEPGRTWSGLARPYSAQIGPIDYGFTERLRCMGFIDQLKKLTTLTTTRIMRTLPESGRQAACFQAQQPSASSFDAGDKRNKVVNIHATAQLQVVLVKPERFENSTEIADHLRDKRTVVLNLESTPKEMARRILDFLSGVAYAQDGKIKKVAVSTYIITPYNVDILET
jgi:cell division inhibitor SepF